MDLFYGSFYKQRERIILFLTFHKVEF